jgi:hypothetical protein
MATPRFEMTPALLCLLERSQVNCTYPCCGLWAFGIDPPVIKGWVRRFGAHAVEDTILHLDAVLVACERGDDLPWPDTTSWMADPPTRGELLTFFRKLRRGLLSR